MCVYVCACCVWEVRLSAALQEMWFALLLVDEVIMVSRESADGAFMCYVSAVRWSWFE